jgi:polyhydroxyalkanoate synthesis regulator phasin
VRSITSEQVERIIELKLANPDLGYREIGKRVGLKKDKVMQAWKMAEPVLALAKEIPKEPERPRDEGEFYSEAFSMIERFLKRGLKPADIVIELVKRLKISPEKAREAVEKYFEQKRLNVIELEMKLRRKLATLEKKIGEIDVLQEWADGIDADIRSLKQKIELVLPIIQRVGQLEMDMMQVINSLNRVIRNLNVAISALSHVGLVVKFGSIPELKQHRYLNRGIFG